jgi:hypothetical protein
MAVQTVTTSTEPVLSRRPVPCYGGTACQMVLPGGRTVINPYQRVWWNHPGWHPGSNLLGRMALGRNARRPR